MAKKRTQFVSEHKCKDCAHSYDFHSPAIDGHMILCRCPYEGDGGRWSIFTKQMACKKYKAR